MKNLIILTIILFAVQFLAPISAQTEQKPELVVQTGHAAGIFEIAFSPNGKLLASASWDGTIKLWDIATGREIRSFTGIEGNVDSLAFSPGGETLASGSSGISKTGNEGIVNLWDLPTGKHLKSFKSQAPVVKSIAFSPDGKTLALGGRSETIYDSRGIIELWDTETSRLLKYVLIPTVNSVTFSPDGKILASATQNNILLYDLETDREITTLTSHEYEVFSVFFSSDGRILASASSDVINFWQVTNDKLEVKSIKGQKNDPFALSPDGKSFVSGGNDGDFIIKLWDVEKGYILNSFNTGHKHRIESIVFSPDGKTFASGSIDETIKLWDVKTGQEIKTMKGLSNWVVSLSFSPDGKTLASGSGDMVIRFWNLEKGQQIKSFDNVPKDIWIEGTDNLPLNFSSDWKFLITGGYQSKINLWNIETGQPSNVLKANEIWFDLALSPEGKILATLENCIIKIWDVKTGQIIKKLDPQIPHSLKNEIYGNCYDGFVAFSPDGKTFATADSRYRIRLINVKSWQQTNSLIGHPQGTGICAFAFSPDSKRMASSGYFDNTIKLWNVATGLQMKSFAGHTSFLNSITFSPDGKYLASASRDKTIKLWDIETGKEIKSFRDHTNRATSVVFSPNGKLLFSGSYDATVKVWHIDSGKSIATLISLGKNDWIVSTPDGRFDTNKLENPEGLHWIVPDAPFTPLSFEVFMRDYFEPKLLPRLLKCTEEANCEQEFKPVRDLSSLNRTQPKIEIKEIKKTASPDTVEVTVEAENVTSEFQKGEDKKPLDSGVFDLRLFRDGQLVEYSTTDENLNKTFRTYKDFDEELKVWREANKVDLKDGKKTFSFQVKLPNNAEDKPIEFSAYAFNDDRVKSETSRKTFTPPAKDAGVQPKPRKAYVITFGVNKYDNAEWNLQFAGNDARAMREIFSAKMRTRKEFAETVEIPLISDDETAGGKTVEKRDATKGNVKTALDLLSGKTVSAESMRSLEKAIGKETMTKIKQANPDDMVLLSFSSHGYADKNGIFYILPTDIGKNSGRKVTDELLRSSISSDELSLWLRDVDAGEMVMIVDACHAASAVEGKDFKPAPMGSRGLGQLAFDKGMKILTATQAANAAIETGGKIGHGLLTYALVREGLEKNNADFRAADKIINLKEWLEYGEFRVPGLYDDLAAGKLKGIGRGVELVAPSNLNSGKKNELYQQPSLFDFTRKKSEMVVAQLP